MALPSALRHVFVVATVLAPAIAPTATAQSAPTAPQQIAAAVLALPEKMREGAGVLGYKTGAKLEVLRASKNGMLCLADDPAEANFHVSCYHDSMDPFMARGRALRAEA
jgi:hypothetical protein